MFQYPNIVYVGIGAKFPEIMWKHLSFNRPDGRINEVGDWISTEKSRNMYMRSLDYPQTSRFPPCDFILA